MTADEWRAVEAEAVRALVADAIIAEADEMRAADPEHRLPTVQDAAEALAARWALAMRDAGGSRAEAGALQLLVLGVAEQLEADLAAALS